MRLVTLSLYCHRDHRQRATVTELLKPHENPCLNDRTLFGKRAMAASGTSDQDEHRDQRQRSISKFEAAGTRDDIEDWPRCDIPYS